MSKYSCATCGLHVTTADDLITVNVDGHARPAHRTCPPPPPPPQTHDGYSFDLTTPRQYTARGGWNVYCECGVHIGESGDDDLDERHDRHVASVTPPGKKTSP